MRKVIAPKNEAGWRKLEESSRREKLSFARRVEYQRTRDAYDLTLYSGAIVTVPRKLIDALRDLPQAEAALVRIGEFGNVLRLDVRDIAISVPGLVREATGLNAAQRRGGQATSKKKTAAVRANGRRGGRPKKTAHITAR